MIKIGRILGGGSLPLARGPLRNECLVDDSIDDGMVGEEGDDAHLKDIVMLEIRYYNHPL